MTDSQPFDPQSLHTAARRSAAFDRRAIPSDASVGTWAASDGWPLRTLRWGTPDEDRRGSLLFLGGRGDHFEKYLETFEHWRLGGWGVESVDWRGQGGSGRLSPDAKVGHVEDFEHWIDDLVAYHADWTARTPGPHAAVGHSMGGHLVLRALAEQRIDPAAAVLIAPMLGFTAPYPDWFGQRVAALMCRIGDPARAAWKISEKPGSTMRMRASLLTHDANRYADEGWWRAAVPETVLGPGSWRWVERAYASMIGLAKPGVLERVTTPILMLVAAHDGLVSAKATLRDAARLPQATTHVYGAEAAHELLREADPVRDDALARIDAFLDQAVTA